MGNVKGKDWFRVPERNLKIPHAAFGDDFIFNHEYYTVCKSYISDREALYQLEDADYPIKDLEWDWKVITDIFLGGHNTKLLELVVGKLSKET